MIGRLKGTLVSKQPPWLLVDVDAQAALPQVTDMGQWELLDRVRRPTDDNETLLILRRVVRP